MAAPTARPHDQDPTQAAAQRQRAYRQRHQWATTDASGNEHTASRGTLLDVLRFVLATRDDPRRSKLHDANKNTARRGLNELVTRYTITPDNEHQEPR